MLTITIRQALEEAIDITDHCLYLYRDGDTVFYVGRSLYPLSRLEEHLGIAGRNLGSRLGDVIKDNLPSSLDWTMEMFTLADCIPLVSPSLTAWYTRKLQENIGLPMRGAYDELANNAEEALMDHYKPCLNVIGRSRNSPAMPLRYAESAKVANSGVKLSAYKKEAR